LALNSNRHFLGLGGGRGACSFFWWGDLKGKSPPGRHRRGWDDNVKTDILEVGWEGKDWIDMA
jgi:hypothetical protein